MTGHKNQNKKNTRDLSYFSLLMTFSHKCYLTVTKKWVKLLNCNLCSPKNTFLAIIFNFGHIRMVAYTAIIKYFLGIFNFKKFEIDSIFAKKN